MIHLAHPKAFFTRAFWSGPPFFSVGLIGGPVFQMDLIRSSMLVYGKACVCLQPPASQSVLNVLDQRKPDINRHKPIYICHTAIMGLPQSAIKRWTGEARMSWNDIHPVMLQCRSWSAHGSPAERSIASCVEGPLSCLWIRDSYYSELTCFHLQCISGKKKKKKITWELHLNSVQSEKK